MKKFENILGDSSNMYYVDPNERESYEDLFFAFLNVIGCDSYGHHADGYVDNSTFTIRPYYWGDDVIETEKPNFVYKPLGLEIRWYKYPMRGAYSNMDIGIEQFKEILDHCTKEYLNSADGRL